MVAPKVKSIAHERESSDSDNYWIDARIIEEMKPEELKDRRMGLK